MQSPAESLQHNLTKPITVPGRFGTVIVSTVAFHAEDVPSGGVGVADGEIDPVARAAHLSIHAPAPPGQLIQDRLLEERLHLSGRSAGLFCKCHMSALRKVEESPKVMHAGCLSPGKVDLLRPQTREDQKLLSGSGDCHIESPLTALVVQRPKVHTNDPDSVRPVADREQDHVTLVSLNRLQVFHKNGLANRGEEWLDFGVLAPCRVQKILYKTLLRLAEGNHAQRVVLLLGVAQSSDDLGDHRLRFFTVCARLPVVIHPVWNLAPAYAELGVLRKR